MAQPPDIARAVFSRINLICAIVAAGLLFGIATIVCFEVIGRALGAPSHLWVIEASEYALLFITFLGAPYLLEKNSHVVLDLLLNHLSGTPKRVAQFSNATIGFAVCAVLTWVGIGVVTEQFSVGVREVTVMRPESWWITAAMPIGTALMTVQFLDAMVRSIASSEE